MGRFLEAYRIQERDKLPNEPYLELARIDFDPAQEAIKDTKSRSKAGQNEINLGFRQVVSLEAPAPAPEKVVSESKETKEPVSTPEPTVIREVVAPPTETITIGHAVLGEAGKDLHSAGLKNLAVEINRQDNLDVNLEENISLDKGIDKYTLIYLTGSSSFELTAEQQSALGDYLKSGGVVFGEGCSEGSEEAAKGSKEFGLAFNQLASKLERKLEMVQRGHPLLSAVYVFSAVPDGAESSMLLEGGGMVYSGSEYGCAWQGGYQEHPLPRDVIRSSIEIGTNIVIHAHRQKSAKG